MVRKVQKPSAKTAFAQRLKALRESAGYETAADMARALGVEEATYRKWERGGAEPPFATLIRIQELTAVSLDFLISGKLMPSPFLEPGKVTRRSA